ncbi:MAG: DUF3108 domain-containing protein, partial [Candidatus Omnitrophica bacterium]|nr:DUF3108 domain-containing protein [Candidatus Omnitrophota bacterium]
LRHYFPYFSPPYKRWKRRARLLLILFLVIAFFYFWQSPGMDQFSGRVSQNEQDKVTEDSEVDRVGEQIDYDVYLGKVKLGRAKYNHMKKMMFQGRMVHLITFETKAMRFRDRETIYCELDTFLPIVVERKVSQFLKPEKIREEYDQKNFVLSITKQRFTTEKHIIKKDAPIHNSILLPYVVRNAKNLDIGWSFEVNLPQRKYEIVLSAIETVKVPAGEFKAYYFESNPKQIRIWISMDENRVPLKLEGTGGILGYKLLMREYSRPEKNVPNSN